MSYAVQCFLDVRGGGIFKETATVESIGGSILNTMGGFNLDKHIDGCDLEITFHVVHEVDIVYQAIIGNNILKQVDMIISGDNVKFQ